MYNLLLTILLVLSVVIVIANFLCNQLKNQSSNVFDASSGDLFERSKARGFEAVMQRFDRNLSLFYWLAIALALTVLSSR